MTTVFIAVGSNLGDRSAAILQAKKKLESNPDIAGFRSSGKLETDPVGGPVQGKFLNCVWQCETGLSAVLLLKVMLQIEADMGRMREELNGPRIIDLDLLFYGNEIIHRPGLVVPHPRLHERRFVLEPLCELAPGLVHPQLKKTVKELLKEIHAHHQNS